MWVCTTHDGQPPPFTIYTVSLLSSFWETNRAGSDFVLVPAAIYAQSRALLDWNARNSFCGTCGHPTLSVNAGTKRTCPPSDLALLHNGTSKDGLRPHCNT